MPADSDTELLERFRRGEQYAFTLLVERYRGLVYGTAIRITQSHALAEEVTQQTFAILAQREFQGRSRPKLLGGWLHQTASFTAMRALRKEIRHRNKLNRFQEELAHRTSSEESAALRQRLDRALLRLGDMDRQIILLRFLNNRSIKEIAEDLGCTEAAIQKRAHRALDKLRRWLSRPSPGITGAAILALLKSEAQAEIAAPALATPTLSQAALSQVSSVPAGITIHQLAQAMIYHHKLKILTAAVGTSAAVILIFNSLNAKDSPAPQSQKTVAAAPTGTWSLVTTARGLGRFAGPQFQTNSYVIDVEKGTWREAGKIPGLPQKPGEATGVDLPANADSAQLAPGDASVAYCLTESENTPASRSKAPAKKSLFLRDAAGAASPRELLTDSNIHEFVWSPDGHWLACSHDDHLSIFDAKDGSVVARTGYSELNQKLFAHAAEHLCWRPDSSAIAFRVLFQGGRLATQGEVSRMEGDNVIYVLRRSTGITKAITLPVTHIVDPHTSLMPVRWQSTAPSPGTPYQSGI